MNETYTTFIDEEYTVSVPASTHDPAPSPTQTGCPVAHGSHHGYEPFDQNDPFPAYAELRREEPVMYDDRLGYWVVSRYDDIKTVFDNWETFSSENAQAPVKPLDEAAKKIMAEGGFTAYSGLSARVPPDHTRIRAIVQKAFTPRRYKVMEPFIRDNVGQLIDRMLERPEHRGDILQNVATDVPTLTILTLLGVDVSMVSTYKKWSDSRSALTWGGLEGDEQVPHAKNLVDYWNECQSLVAKAHREGGDNLVADLVKAQEAGAEISDHEIASVCYSLLFAGHETTTTLISNAVRLIAGQGQWKRLQEDPKVIPGAVEEVLRMSGSIVAWRRKALRDATVGGVDIPAGSTLLLLMGSANRDDAHFENPDTFEPTRPNAREHLSFGYGIHYCLGNKLAKLQTVITLEELTRRIPSLALTKGDIEFIPNLSFRTPQTVPVSWES